MPHTPLRVGFDLDGVLLYNPARTVRLPVSIVTRILFKKKGVKFYIPTKPHEKFIWHIFHLSSLFVEPGVEIIDQLVKEKKIQAHIVTARFSFLENDLLRWEHKLDKNNTFTSINYNKNDEQPHIFKEKMIKKLNIDIFVEDNIDIVRHLKATTNAQIYWIYNIVDHFVPYSYKFPRLKKAVLAIEKVARQG